MNASIAAASAGSCGLPITGTLRRQNVDPIRRAAQQPPWPTLGELGRIRRHRAEAEFNERRVQPLAVCERRFDQHVQVLREARLGV
jgi:hypothetical protein